MCCESYMHAACILKKIEVIFQIRGKVRGSEIVSCQKSLNDFVDNQGLVAMCIIRLRKYRESFSTVMQILNACA